MSGYPASAPSLRPVRSMIPSRVRRFVEDLLPWWDRAEEARHDERSAYIHDRSIAIRQHVERSIPEVRAVGAERIRSAYRRSADRLDR